MRCAISRLPQALRASRKSRPSRQGETIILVKDVDKLSPRFAQALARRERFPQVEIEFYRGKEPIHLPLKNVVVSSIQPIATGSGRKEEIIRLVSTGSAQPK